MTNRERAKAILHYEKVDRVPVVAFGYWNETLEKWQQEGYVTEEEVHGYATQGDNSPADKSIMAKLGFDFNWNACVGGNNGLSPHFERQVLETSADGSQVIRDETGLIVRVKKDIVSIPAEIGTTLTDREAWEELYLPTLQYAESRVNMEYLQKIKEQDATREIPLGLHCGSLYGNVRNMLGVEELSYMAADDEDLYREIIDTNADLSYKVVKKVLEAGVDFDYAHYWEDICFKNGPLVRPEVFAEVVGPHYKKTTELLNAHGIDIISLDCDGWIDKLIPIWLENGVNTMFPIEVGTWNASIAPWREQYGKTLRGVGGMDKRVFAHDKAAVDAEIERLKPLVELGGYIPCPDHRIAPDAKFELVQYYCEQFRKTFG